MGRAKADEIWTDEYPKLLRSERVRVARRAQGWTFALLLATALAVTSVLIWYGLFLVGNMGG